MGAVVDDTVTFKGNASVSVLGGSPGGTIQWELLDFALDQDPTVTFSLGPLETQLRADILAEARLLATLQAPALIGTVEYTIDTNLFSKSDFRGGTVNVGTSSFQVLSGSVSGQSGSITDLGFSLGLDASGSLDLGARAVARFSSDFFDFSQTLFDGSLHVVDFAGSLDLVDVRFADLAGNTKKIDFGNYGSITLAMPGAVNSSGLLAAAASPGQWSAITATGTSSPFLTGSVSLGGLLQDTLGVPLAGSYQVFNVDFPGFPISKILDVAGKIVDVIVDGAGNAYDEAGHIVARVKADLHSLVDSSGRLVGDLWGTIKEIVQPGGSIILAIETAGRKFLDSAGNIIYEYAGKTNDIINYTTKAFVGVIDTTQLLGDQIVKGTLNLAGQIFDSAGNLIATVGNYIQQAGGAIGSALQTIGSVFGWKVMAEPFHGGLKPEILDLTVDYSLLDLQTVLDTRLAESLKFVPDGVGLVISTSLGQVVNASLGSPIAIDLPMTGEGSVQVQVAYSLHGQLTSTFGIAGSGYARAVAGDVALNGLSLIGGPLVDERSPANPQPGAIVPLAQTTQAVTLPTVVQTYTVTYFNDDTLIGDDKANDLSGGRGNDTLIGGGGDDILRGGADDDTLDGGSDNDTLSSGGGVDSLSGGPGSDVLIADGPVGKGSLFNGGGGTDRLEITAAAASVTGPSGDTVVLSVATISEIETLRFDSTAGSTLRAVVSADQAEGIATLEGGAGADAFVVSVSTPGTYTLRSYQLVGWIDGTDFVVLSANGAIGQYLLNAAPHGGTVRLVGSAQADTLHGSDGVEILVGGAGNDQLEGEGGNDSLDGGDGRDYLFGGAGNDTLTGGADADLFEPSFGQDLITDFKIGIDKVTLVDLHFTSFAQLQPYMTQSGSDTVFSYLYGGVVNTLTLQNVASSSLSASDFMFASPSGAIDVTGTDQADTILGLNGNDRIDGGDGDDRIFGYDGNDILLGGKGNDRVEGGEGNDTLVSGGGIDTLLAGPGDDTLIADGPVGTGSVFGGNLGDDRLEIREGAASLATPNGPVVPLQLATVADVDRLRFLSTAGNGLRVVVSPAQANGITTLEGGPGADSLLVAAAAPGTYSLRGFQLVGWTEGTDQIVMTAGGVAGAFTLIAAAHPGTVRLVGGSGDDTLRGGDGTDVLIGNAGRDELTGDAGNDTLDGGDGEDILSGGEGNDRLTGGADADRFAPSAGQDLVTDFKPGTDKVALADLHFSSFAQLQPYIAPAGGDTLFSYLYNGVVNTLTLQNVAPSSLVADDFVFADANGAVNEMGTDNADIILGLNGNDVIDGRGGDDRIFGYAGEDVLQGGKGNDQFFLQDLTAEAAIDGGADSDSLVIGGSVDFRGSLANVEAVVLQEGGRLQIGGAAWKGLPAALALDGDGTITIDLQPGQVIDTAGYLFKPGSHVTLAFVEEGAVADGHIAGATVFVDADGDGVLDSNEAKAVTDAAGAFRFVAPAQGPLRAFGGTDVDTGLPNDLMLSAPSGATIVNPLTTLVQALIEERPALSPALSIAAAQDKVRSALGLGDQLDLVTTDLLVAIGRGDAGAFGAQKQAASVVKILDAVRVLGGDTGDALAALAQDIASAPAGQKLNLADLALLKQVFSAAGLGTASITDTAAVLTQIQASTTLSGLSEIQAKDLAAISGTNGKDVLTGSALNEKISGDNGNDTLDGKGGADRLFGENGSDILYGGNGNDLLAGGNGNDTLDGGAGDDVLSGGKGPDVMAGGAGADLFVFDKADSAEKDIITGFAKGSDKFYFAAGMAVTSVVQTRGSTTLSLSDGGKIELTGVLMTDAEVKLSTVAALPVWVEVWNIA